MKKVELLAPAGTFEALQAAINAGADAIYLGGRSFGARHYASNFDNEELIKAIDLAHMYRVRIYVTVNILVDDTETDDLVEYLKFLEMIGVDAIIVQDIGVVDIAKKVAPNLEIHASTQMSIMNSEAVKFAEQAGVSRVVMARECSVDELREIKAQTGVELEVFIHGAICVSYSGQCLMSSMIGGRSGNRGRCAQPCRLPYTLVDNEDNNLLDPQVGQYLLSPKDFNTLDVVPELIEAGVGSFKIEGRMKKPEYVAIVVQTYRKAIDAYYEKKNQLTEDDYRNITQVFNRDFTQAYLLERPGRKFISDKRPNNRGVLIGRVSSYDHQQHLAGIKLEEDLSVGDGIEFWVTVGGRVVLTITEMLVAGEAVEQAYKGQEVVISVPAAVRITDRVFRTFDSKLNNYANGFFGNNSMKKIPVTAKVTARVGDPMEIFFEDAEGNIGSAKTEFVGQVAIKRPLTAETVEKQLERLGNTHFELGRWELLADDNVMFPISEINEARRQAIDNLYVARVNSYGEKETRSAVDFVFPKKTKKIVSTPLINVMIDTLEQAQAAIKCGADVVTVSGEAFSHRELTPEECRTVVELAEAHAKKAIIAFPRVVKEFNIAYLLDRVEKIAKIKPHALLVGNMGLMNAAQKTNIPIWLDFGLNTFNSVSAGYWESLNVETVTLSPELTFQQIRHIADRTNIKVECLAQGRTEMMVSEYCVAGSFLGDIHKQDCYGACQQKLYLKDRMDERFPIVTDQFCRMHVLNAKELNMSNFVDNFAQAGVDYLRIDARYMSVAELKTAVESFKNPTNADDGILDAERKYTKGHYFRGVLE